MDDYQELAKLKCENDELKHRCASYEKILECYEKMISKRQIIEYLINNRFDFK